MTNIQKRLFSMQDDEYREFNSKLIPTVDERRVIGVRIPHIRKYAKELFKSGQYAEFIKNLPHEYFEEDNLHAFILEQITDYDELIFQLDRFLPFVDNWATCDSMNLKALGKYPEKTKQNALRWINSDDEYAVRYGILLLMKYFLGENFTPDVLETVAAVRRDRYYINMMISWFFATALAKQYESAIVYISECRLSTWCHNKTIQKATESFRITAEQKENLKAHKKTPTH